MFKTKYLFVLIALIGLFAACKKSTPIDNYNPNPQFKIDTAAIRSFVNAHNIPAVKDQYGIFYEILASGSGATPYTSNTIVTVDYEGRLLNGDIFDSTKGTPIELTLGTLIGGWQIGLQKIQKGGQIRLIIPSYYGYGTVAKPGIPPNSPLDFTITLTDVK